MRIKMQIININKTDRSLVIQKAAKVLSNGGILIYPTETAYGVGVDATNQGAVDRVLEYKARMSGKPLSIAVCDEQMARQYAKVNKTAQSIYQNFLPGPVTAISHGFHRVANGVESERGTLGIRIPDYDLILEIIREFGRPITATSANLSGQKTPYSINDILDTISNKRRAMVDLILDAGQLPKRPTSTVVDTTMEDYQVLRQGAVDLPKRRDAPAGASTYVSKSAEETQKIAKDLLLYHISVLKRKCLIFALEGDLGTGKTQFAKGLAQALQISEPIVSPTFNIIAEYPISFLSQTSQLSSIFSLLSSKFYHLDTWRLLNPAELNNLGLNEMIKPGNVVAIEWADKLDMSNVTSRMSNIVRVKFEHKSENSRFIRIFPLSPL